MDDEYTNGSDSLAMSQLDVISCGLGGAVLLGLVFSVIGSTPPVETSAPEYVAVEFFTSTDDSVVSLLIRPPDYSEVELDIEEWFDESGHVRAEKRDSFPLQSFGEFQLIVTQHNARTKRDVDEDGSSEEFDCITILVGSPAGGNWAFNTRFADQSDESWSQLLSQTASTSPTPLTIWRRFETRLSSSDGIEKIEQVHFGWTTNHRSSSAAYEDKFEPIAVAGERS